MSRFDPAFAAAPGPVSLIGTDARLLAFVGKSWVALGSPLPFGVRDSTLVLLLARTGDRRRRAIAGAVPARRSGHAGNSTAQLRAEWDKCGGDVRLALASQLALLQVVRRTESGSSSGNCGVPGRCTRLGWSATGQRRAPQAALAMNISMIELQARLATQGMVTRNGDKAHHPRAATFTDVTGAPRLSPRMRDTARRESAVVALVSKQVMSTRLTDEKIADLIGGDSGARARRAAGAGAGAGAVPVPCRCRGPVRG
jgi:hypothetical protein